MVQLLTEIQKMCERQNIHLEQLKGQIIFMSMYNDVDWHQKRKEEVRKQYSPCVVLRPEEEEPLVCQPLLQATWEVQLRRSGHDVHLRRTRTSSIQVFKPTVKECNEK